MLGRLPHLGLFGAPGAGRRGGGRRGHGRRPNAAPGAAPAARALGRRTPARAAGPRARRRGPVLLLDEPTTHLDPPHQVALVRLLRRLRRGAAVVSVLHDLPLALLADRVVVMQAAGSSPTAPHGPALHAALERVFEGAVRVRGWKDASSCCRGWTATAIDVAAPAVDDGSPARGFDARRADRGNLSCEQSSPCSSRYSCRAAPRPARLRRVLARYCTTKRLVPRWPCRAPATSLRSTRPCTTTCERPRRRCCASAARRAGLSTPCTRSNN